MGREPAWLDALLAPAKSAPPGLSTWNGSDPARRFAVYRNNVTVSLVNALADTFAVTRQLVGEEFFRAMAREFVYSSPPDSPLLTEYGSGFPTFIASFPPAAALPYLADTARLEFSYLQAYHAADAVPLPPEQFSSLLARPEALAAVRLDLHPSLHTLQSRYAVASLWAAHQGLGDLADVDPGVAENAWVVRNGLQVLVLRMRTGDCQFAGAMQRGQPLGEAAKLALEADPEFDLTTCLAIMLREQLVIAIEG